MMGIIHSFEGYNKSDVKNSIEEINSGILSYIEAEDDLEVVFMSTKNWDIRNVLEDILQERMFDQYEYFIVSKEILDKIINKFEILKNDPLADKTHIWVSSQQDFVDYLKKLNKIKETFDWETMYLFYYYG